MTTILPFRDQKKNFLPADVISKRVFLPAAITRDEASETKKTILPSCGRRPQVRASFDLCKNAVL